MSLKRFGGELALLEWPSLKALGPLLPLSGFGSAFEVGREMRLAWNEKEESRRDQTQATGVHRWRRGALRDTYLLSFDSTFF